MASHFWNDHNFRGLLELASALGEYPSFAELSDYCTLREKGLRRQAMQSVAAFVRKASSWSPQERTAAVARLMQLWHQHRHAHQFLTHPLQSGFVLPALNEWRVAEPQNSVAARWLGLLTNEETHLQAAVTLDSTDDIARARLIDFRLGIVDYATHHLCESLFIGSIESAEEALLHARTLIDELVAAEYRERYLQEWNYLRQLLADWAEYQKEPSGSFPAWCETRGRHDSFGAVVYYDAG